MCLHMDVKFSRDPRVLTRMTLPNYYILQAPPHPYGPLITCTCHCCWAGEHPKICIYIMYCMWMYLCIYIYLHVRINIHIAYLYIYILKKTSTFMLHVAIAVPCFVQENRWMILASFSQFWRRKTPVFTEKASLGLFKIKNKP